MSKPAPKRRSLLAVLLRPALLLLPLAATALAGEPLPEAVSQVKRAVVVVNTFDERGKPLFRGSGFFVGGSRLVTNLHVVGTAARVEVKTFDGQTLRVAGAVAFDASRDLALLETSAPPAGVATLELEESGPSVGEEIFVVGHPNGGACEVTRGNALTLWRFQEAGEMLRITAAISRGSSGSPVVNLRGRVVGVATMNLRRSGDFYFAVPGQDILSLRPDRLAPFPLQAAP